MGVKRPIGSDRLRVDEDGSLVLTSRYPKDDWVPGRSAEGVRGEFPGTCVRWGDEMYEVLSREEAGVGVRYRLRSWREDQTIRTITDYDEATEEKREEERAQATRREVSAGSFSLGAILTGLLPADVQRELESELGISAGRATLYSAIPLLLAGGFGLIGFLASAFGGNSFGLPVWLYFALIYFWVESMVRIGLALSQSRPIGSFPVVLIWEMISTLRGRRRVKPARLEYEPDPSETERDGFIQFEPFIALLSPSEQLAIDRRYGFDWRSRGRRSAFALLGFAILVTLVTLFGSGAGSRAATLVTMFYLIVEQIMRLVRISNGSPAGSVFGIVIRPLAKRALRL